MHDMLKLLDNLKSTLQSFRQGPTSLEEELEAAAKHMPAYLKIVKSHIEQLAQVLELETHNHKKLEHANLAEPVVQLMQLFKELQVEDLQLLENLAYTAKTWQVPETSTATLTTT